MAMHVFISKLDGSSKKFETPQTKPALSVGWVGRRTMWARIPEVRRGKKTGTRCDYSNYHSQFSPSFFSASLCTGEQRRDRDSNTRNLNLAAVHELFQSVQELKRALGLLRTSSINSADVIKA